MLSDEINKENLKEQIEKEANRIIQENAPVSLHFMEKEEMLKICKNVPENIPLDKPSRVVMYGENGIPCGGTHVKDLKSIELITVRKIKLKKGILTVAYNVKQNM